MGNRKEALKKLTAVSTAMLMVGTVIMATPLTARAFDDPNPEGSTINVGKGEILEDNNGTVDVNYGEIINNNDGGCVDSNRGLIDVNHEGGEIRSQTSYGTVELNEGYINWSLGKIGTNNGTVRSNSTLGVINENNGLVESNSGIIVNNNGRVINNYHASEIGGIPAEHQWWYIDVDADYEYYKVRPYYDEENSDIVNQYIEEAEGKTGILIFKAQEGYTVTTGNGEAKIPASCNATLEQSGNDYVIHITSITGDVLFNFHDLNLIVKAIEEGEGGTGGNITVVVDDSIVVVPGSDDGQSSGYASSDAIPAGAITIALPRTTDTTGGAAAPEGPSVLGAGRVPTRTASFKVSQLTDSQLKQAIISNINSTPAGGLVRFEFDRMGCLDRAMLEAFAQKSNIEMQVRFPFGNKNFSVTIPAGFDINKLLDKNGYCGFLRLLSFLGSDHE